MIAGFRLPSDHLVDFGIGPGIRPAFLFPCPVRVQRRLRGNITRLAHADPQALEVSGLAQETEIDCRADIRIRRFEPYLATAPFPQRADTHRETADILADIEINEMERKEVVLDIRMGHGITGLRERAREHGVGRAYSGPAEEPADAGDRPGERSGIAVERFPERSLERDVKLDMLLKVLPDTGKVVDHIDS